MKNYLKIGILLFGLILIMTNCETENEVMENPITIEKEFIIKQYHFKDLSSNFKFQKAIEKLNSKNSKSIYSNKSTDDIYNFTIDSTRIKEVIKGNYTSYTLLINRPFKTSEYFENLVIEIKENETINAFIIKYILSSPIKIFEEHNSFSFQANFTIVSLDINNINLSSKSTTDDCSPIAQTWCNWSYPHIAGPSCYEANDGRLFTVLAENPNCTENGDPSSGGGGGGGTTGSDPDPIYTSPINPDGTPVEFPESVILNQINEILGNSLSENQLFWLYNNPKQANNIKLFLDSNNSPETKNFVKSAVEALTNNQYLSFDEILYNRTELDNNITGDIDNNITGGYDSTIYNTFNPTQETWPTINSVILLNDFIGWKANDPISQRNCMAYAKAQIAKKSYQISNYKNVNGQISDQTIQIFTEQNGVNQTELQKGLSYLKYALDNGIPVIVGVDAHSGSPNPNTDSTTDHFVVIVGMGTDNNGQYFIFYDNASGQTPYQNYGANPNNRFYYNSSTGTLTGRSQTRFSLRAPRIYTVTQIKKSKSL